MIRFNKRHIVKSFSWRFIAFFDTLLLSSFFSGNINFASKIVLFEFFSKIIIYYFHERIWYKSNFRNKKSRHLIKTFTWRILGSIDTFIIGTLIIGDSIIALSISSFEIFSKLILYYIHEKIWYKSNFGLDKRKNEIKY